MGVPLDAHNWRISITLNLPNNGHTTKGVAMRIARMGLLTGLFCALGAGAVGCQNKMHDDNVALHRQNRELQEAKSRTDAELAQRPDPTQVAALQQQIAERDARINELQTQVAKPAPAPAPGASAGSADPSIAGVETTFDNSSGKTTLAVPGDVLFAPGDANIRDEAKPTLDKVVATIKRSYAGKSLRIEGHTDKDPIRASKWKSNHELSEARAAAVKAYLVKKGIAPTLITVVGYGADKPKAKDKATNRRVDIVVAMR